MSQRQLPLFPLNVVLFPGAILPLHVFEERYKLMVQRCLEGDSTFGVVLIKSGAEVGEPAEPHSIGTTARITGTRPVDGGRLMLNTVGEKRFRILEITQRRPYIEGQVEILDDEVGLSLPADEREAIEGAITRHLSLILGSRGGWVGRAKIPRDPAELSYFIAAVLQSDVKARQSLLEEPSAAMRLQTELEMMEREAGPLGKRVQRELGKRFSAN